MKSGIMTILGIILFCAFVYGMYWVFKTVSYSIFYEAMVEQTIIDLVKPEYLK